MEYLITGTVIGLCLFILPMWAYRKGLKDGLNINQGKDIEPIKTPVRMVREAREAKKSQEETDKITQGLMNILTYDGTPQKAGEDD